MILLVKLSNINSGSANARETVACFVGLVAVASSGGDDDLQAMVTNEVRERGASAGKLDPYWSGTLELQGVASCGV